MGGRGGVGAGGGTSVAPGVMGARAATGDREPQQPPHRPGSPGVTRRRGGTRGDSPPTGRLAPFGCDGEEGGWSVSGISAIPQK